MNRLDICVCILFFEKLDQTIECIDSIQQPDINIYILNNGSSAESRRKLGHHCSHYANIVIFDSPVNLGPSKGRNFLLKNTKEEWSLFLDNDITISTKDWLDKVIKQITKYPDAEAFFPKVLNPHEKSYMILTGFEIINNRLERKLNIFSSETNIVLGGAGFYRRSMWQRLGFYDEELFTIEDFELSIRAIRSGKPVRGRIIRDITFIHEHRFAATPEDKRSVLVRYDSDEHRKALEHVSRKHNLEWDVQLDVWIKRQTDHMVHGKNYQRPARKYFFLKPVYFVYYLIRKMYASMRASR